MTGLQKFLKGWRPNPVVETDPMNPAAASALAATLDIPKQVFAAGDVLPALWQWVYFPHWPQHSGLGNDGHPATGRFMPPLPDRRRMFAGGRVHLDRKSTRLNSSHVAISSAVSCLTKRNTQARAR